MSFCSMKDSILEKTNFSKILLKLDSKEIGLWLFALVLSSALKIVIIFSIFSLVGYIPVEIERFIISASVLLIKFDEYFNS